MGPAASMAIGVLIGCCIMAGVRPIFLRCYVFLTGIFVASQKKAPVKCDLHKRMVQTVTEAELRMLVEQLDDSGNLNWESAIEKTSPTVSYSARRRDPEDGGPTQIVSTTVFENCSTEQARDFYMDSEFRKGWDSTFVLQEQLDMCKETGTETGRIVKKFPLMTPREYVLAWRVWEGEDNTFYCFIKACEHDLAPRQNKLKRVELYNSGWRIRKVLGRNACEINMMHQEDLCMKREMAKMAFTRGIWGYVRKMDTNLRKFTVHGDQGHNAVSLAHMVPSDKLLPTGPGRSLISAAIPPTTRLVASNNYKTTERNPHVRETAITKQKLADGLILVSGAVFCSHCSASWGLKIVAACLIRRLVRPHTLYRRSEFRTC